MNPIEPSSAVETPTSTQHSEGLRQRLAEARRRAAAGSGIPSRGASGPAPLSPVQERIWYQERLHPGTPVYNIAHALDLAGPVDAAALEQALRRLTERHEILRTGFAEIDDEPRQTPAAHVEVRLPREDLSALPAGERDEALARLTIEEAAAPFDLAAPPLFRVRLVCLGREEHRLLLTFHHLIFDGWSLGIFLRELSALYPGPAADGGGEPEELPPLPIQYADYAVWERRRQREGGEALERAVEIFARRLGDEPPVLELPADRPRPAVPSLAGGCLDFRLPDPLTEALRRLVRKEEATPFMGILAAWGALLGRLGGLDRVVVGAPAANRGDRATEGLVGFFVNTLALAVDLGGEPTGRELLGRVRETVLEALAHDSLPLERLVQRLAPRRSSRHAPLFQTLAVLSTPPVSELGLPGVRVTGIATPFNGAVEGDLMLLVEEQPDGGLAAQLAYSRDLFDAASAERLGQRFLQLLEGLVSAPEQPVARLPLLLAEERHLLEEWNATARDFPRQATLHGLVEAQARRTPHAEALRCGTDRVTYAELDRRAAALARRLRSLGVGPEVPVGVGLERRADLVVALLGILKAGGFYVPLDPAYPAERLAFMLEDSGAPVVVTRPGLLAPEALAGRQVVTPSADGTAAPPLPAVAPEQLAYVIYTSGSTGRPKGVAISHASAATLVQWAREVFSEEELSGVAATTSVCFDLSVFEIFVPLAWGGRVILVDDALALLALPPEEAEAVRLVNTVPSAASELARAEGLPPRVTTVNLAGEPLKRALVDRLYEHPPVTAVYDLYGPSEDTTYSTFSRPGRGETGEPHIGGPIAGTRAFVLDRGGLPVPPGVVGELCLAGAGLARGYLGRPALTAERFVPDPHSPEPGGRLYRTGDLARRRADGPLDFLGRADHQVKVRGFRIELGEIEAALLRHPAVRECVVVAWGEEAAAERRLVAYVAAEPAAEPAPDLPAVLAADLAEHLPAHMVPTLFVVLPALPLTPNGKVDRKALPDPAAERARGAWEPPRGETEEQLAEIWRQVLGVDRVGAGDDFFALGGHSLLATRLAARLRSQLGVEVPLGRLLEAPTLRRMAAEVEQRRAAGSTAAPPLVPVPRPEGMDLPLSFSQERLWFLDRILPLKAAYNIPYDLRLDGPLEVEALGRALGEIVRRHEVLRTVFPAPGGQPVARILPPAPLPLPFEDLSHLPAAEAEAEASRQAAELAGTELDLAAGPLVAARLLRLGDSAHRLLLVLHHIVADAWSMEILFGELATLYEAFHRGETPELPELPPLPVQYADYAVWQRGWLAGDVLDTQMEFWRRRLAGAPTLLELPTDRPRPPVASYRGAAATAQLPRQTVEALDALALREGATLFMAFLAVWMVLLGRCSRQDDLCVGTPISGRRHEKTEDLIGLFLNTLVLRGDLSGAPTYRELLGRVRATTLAAFDHQDLPFEKLVQELETQRSLAHAPLFQVLFVHQRDAWRRRSGALALDARAVPGGTAKFDLVLHIDPGERPAAQIEYNTDLFEPATIQRLLEQLRILSAAAAESPDRRVADLPWLTSAERRQVLETFNPPTPGEPPEVPVHGLVETWAERRPAAVAVVAGGEELTYGELDRRANRLAHRLRRLGVGPEVPVGVSTERGLPMAVAVLGVLKAGGAYLPLDPAYPSERLAFMLEDAAAPVVVTHGDRFPDPGRARVVRLDDGGLAGDGPDEERLEDEASSPPAGAAHPDQLAYLLYTSGSTGRPKGVAMPHRPLANLLGWQMRRSSRREGARTLQFASLSFDVSFQEMFSTWAAGGTLVLVDEEVRRDASQLLRLLADERVERLFLPFVALQLLAEVADRDGAPPPALTEVITAGEQLQITAPVEGLFRRLPGAELDNHYGPTECHVVTAHRLAGAAEAWPALPPIGKPIDHTRILLLDPAGRPVPVGVPGELHVGGVALARGYLGRPALTAERFVPDPFSEAPGARLYRTGDLARWLPDGEIEFLGRADSQVKVRGFRVEPGEIEVRLSGHPGVAEAVVLARDDERGNRQLVAYFTPAGDAPEAAELKQFLAERLPEHMVPSAFVRLDGLPQTPSGKVDRRSLAAVAPTSEALVARADFLAPRTPAEKLLAVLWQELLGVAEVGARDNFFDLGGHSLHAARHMYRLEESLDLHLSVRALFEAQTLEELARRLETAVAEAVEAEAPEADAEERSRLAAERLAGAHEKSAYSEAIPRRPDPEAPTPLSWSEEILWFVEQQATMPPAIYRFAPILNLRGRLDEEALRRTFHALAARHEILRTRFGAHDDGTSWQRVDPSMTLEPARLDVSHLPPDERAAAARQAADELADRRFDLTRGPMMRPLLIRFSAEHHWLLLSMHHIIIDDWGFGVLYRDLSELYGAFVTGGEPRLPDLTVQYADYALWDRQRLEGPFLDHLTRYWRGRFADGLPQMRFRTDRPRPPLPSYRATFLLHPLPRELSSALRRRAREEDASLFMVLLTGLKLLLGAWSEESTDIMVAVAHANRPRQQTEEILGSFFNLLLMRTSLADDPTLRELLGRVKETALEAYAHQDFPFILVAPGYESPDIPPGKPPVQALFTFQNTPPHELRFEGLEVEILPEKAEIDLDIDLLFSIRDHAEDLTVILLFDTDIFEAETVKHRLEQLQGLLEILGHHPERRLSEIAGLGLS